MPAISNIETSEHSQELFKTAHFKGIQKQNIFRDACGFLTAKRLAESG